MRDRWIGEYDVKMVGSTALQPAFVSSVNPVVVSGFFSDDILNRSGYSFASNNRFTEFPDYNNLLAENVQNNCPFFDICAEYLDSQCDTNSTSLLRYKTEKVKTALVYADCDSDFNTFQSSWAYLDLGEDECEKIHSAYLYWVGGFEDYTATYAIYPETETMRSYAGGLVGNASNNFENVLFRVPDSEGYYSVVADDVYLSSTYKSSYICIADVSDFVKNSGTGKYWVANIQTSSTNYAIGAGWCLVVVHSSPRGVQRDVVLYDGYEGLLASGLSRDVVLEDLNIPVVQEFSSYLGIAALDGEKLSKFNYKSRC